MILLFEQVLRFGAVGIVNSSIGLGCIWTAMLAGVPPLPANALGFGIGLTVSFMLNRGWTFRHADKAAHPLPWTATAPRFAGAFAVAWTLNAATVGTVISLTTISPYVAQIAGLAVYSVTFFILCRTWVFAVGNTESGTAAKLRLGELLARAALFSPLAIALAYLVSKAFDPSVASVDFKYLWFAGRLWADGTSPYGAQYFERARAFFVNTNVPVWMVYPPNWYPLASTFAILPLDVAERLWGALSAAMLLVSSALIARTVWSVRERNEIWLFIAFGTFICMGSATAIALSLGQTAPFMAVGLALFLHGFMNRSQVALTTALVILMLKPNFGIPFVAFLLVWPGLWLAVMGAGAVSIAAASWAFAPYGPATVLQAYFEQLSSYGGDPVNMPPSQIGLVNVVYNWLGLNIGSFFPIGLAIIASFTLAFWLKNVEENRRSADRVRLAAALVLVGCVIFLVPLHTYDLLLASPLLLLPAMSRSKLGVVTTGTLISFLILFRVNSLAKMTGLTFPAETYFAGSAIASFALLLLLLVSFGHFWMVTRRTVITGTLPIL